MSLDAKLARESRFWDAKAAQDAAEDPDLYRVEAGDRHDRSIPWGAQLGFPAFVQTVLDRLGGVRDKRVLDLGTGTGFLASLLAAEGARVEAVDVSAASLATARRRATISGVADRIGFHHGPAETLPFPDGSFDAVCGAFVLHHLDLPVAGSELKRVLAPGGRGAFIETSANNLLLMAARRLLPGRFGIEKASSDDEAPLGRAARDVLAGTFGPSVRLDYPELVFFRMASYVPPLHRPPAQRLLRGIDAALHRIPPLRAQSYHCVVSFTRE